MSNRKKFSEVTELWKTDKKQYVKRSTYAAYFLQTENHLLPAFGDNYSIQEADVQKFVLQKIAIGLSQKTIKDILIVLKMILKFGAKNGWYKNEPFEIQYPTTHKDNSLQILSKAQQKKIMNYIKEHFSFKNLGIYICLSSGMRIGEICALTWKDIDTENGIIHIRKTLQRIYIIEEGNRRTELVLDAPKTKDSMREIPLSRDLSRIIKPIKNTSNPNFFVLTNNNKPTEPRSYRYYYKNLMKQLEIPAIKFHGLRHSFATRCIESNCDYKTVSVLLGHSSINTTLNLYVHPNMEQKKKVIEQMFKALR